MDGHSSSAVHWHMSDLTSRIVADSGNPADRYHLGKIVLRGFKDDPAFVHQIDAVSGRSETNEYVLKKTIRCATAMKNMGLKVGDVMVLMAPNHLDLVIPFYAALYLGVAIAPIDKSLGVYELQATFEVDRPKIVFCQSDRQNDVHTALENLQLDAKIITFDEGTGCDSFADMLKKYGEDDEHFKGDNFNPEETIALLISTSGTTGLPKAAALTHKNIVIMSPYPWVYFTECPTPIRSALTMAPLQWLSTIIKVLMAPILRFTRIQSALPLTQEHVYDVINQYRPSYMILSPTMMATLLKPGERNRCDFTCFDTIFLGGSAVHKELLIELKKVSPRTACADLYGMSELGSTAFKASFGRPGSCGTRLDCLIYKLVNVETEKEINEANVPGELWLKGPGLFKGYYNNRESTEEAVTKYGWFKTGDMMYRDENWNFYFVDRIKLLLKYRNHQISPVEIENVIRKHPGVLDVAVTGVPHFEFGELAVACVVRNPGCEVTAQDIKDVVRNNLTDTKHLRGGVIFLKELPLTPSTKIHRRKLKELVLNLDRE